jgi:hypothetical protein
MEYREGKGMVLFCQLDVTGRTDPEPAAAVLVSNLLRYVSDWKATPHRAALYAGDPAGRDHLESAGVTLTSYDGGDLSQDQLLIVGPGCGKRLSTSSGKIVPWLNAGGHVLALGVNQEDLAGLPLSSKVTLKRGEHIAAYFEPLGVKSPFAGIGPADIHNRDPREFPLLAAGAQIIGDGVLGQSENGNVIFCQMPPWLFEGSRQFNVRRTFRHASFLVARLLGNLGVAGSAPILERFHRPVSQLELKKRWNAGLYLDQPEEWDDPYRFFRW